MMHLSKIERSRAHVALSRALGDGGDPEGSAARARQSYAYYASHDPAMLAEAGLLAEALIDHVQSRHFCFRMSELAIAAGNLDLAECAAGIVGAEKISHDVWSTAPNAITSPVTIPKTLLRDLLELWACTLPFDGGPEG